MSVEERRKLLNRSSSRRLQLLRQKFISNRVEITRLEIQFISNDVGCTTEFFLTHVRRSMDNWLLCISYLSRVTTRHISTFHKTAMFGRAC